MGIMGHVQAVEYFGYVKARLLAKENGDTRIVMFARRLNRHGWSVTIVTRGGTCTVWGWLESQTITIAHNVEA